MAVVLVDIERKLYFFFYLRRRSTDSRCATNFPFERCGMDRRVVARMGFDDDVRVRRFSVYFSGEFPIGVTGEEDVKEGNATLNLSFASKFDSRMNTVEYLVESLRGVFVVVAATEAWSSRCFILHSAPTVVHVDLEVARECEIFFLRRFLWPFP